jgi:hypothetical protein
MFIPFDIFEEDNSQMFMAGRLRDNFVIKRKIDIVYVTGVREKHDLCFFSGLNDISHLPDQAFSSSRSWLIISFDQQFG